MTPIPPIPDPDPVERYAQLLDCGKSHLAGELVRAEQRIAKLTAEVERHTVKATEFMYERDEARAENTRLKAPVSRHNEADGILQRFFITGGRQYRYTKQDGTDLEDLLNEWLASRATRTPPQEGQ